jgi:hypothetical protein
VIGDSHSSYIVGKPVRRFLKGHDSFYPLWLGPNTLHSVTVLIYWHWYFYRLIKLIKFNSIIFQFGEIDVRVFLCDQQNSFQLPPSVLDDYVKVAKKFSYSVGVKTCLWWLQFLRRILDLTIRSNPDREIYKTGSIATGYWIAI